MSDVPLSERERLEGYVAGSRRVQRALVRGTVVGTPLSIVGAQFYPTIGWSLLAVIVSTAGIGFYITGMHIAEWRQRLYELGH